MKKFEMGLFALSVLIGNYFGSVFGIMIAICSYMTITGLVEEVMKRPRRDLKKEDK